MSSCCYLPNPDQELLLKAALWDGPRALKNWQTFLNKVSFDDIDYGSSRLLPLVYKNLSPVAPQDPYMGRMKGIYRLTWAQNQRFLNRLAPIVHLFQENQIPTLLLKGGALTLTCYEDYGLRGMGDIDLLVPSEHATQAMQLLEQAQWEMKQEYQKLDTSMHHAAHYIDSTTKIDLDLHWHLLVFRSNDAADKLFWEKTSTCQFQDQTIPTLQPVDHLFHTLCHGAAWSNVAPIRWVVDATWLIRKGPIDWDRIVYLTEKLGFVGQFLDTLGFLREIMECPIPKEIIHRLERLPMDDWQKREYAFMSQPRPFLGILPHLWLQNLKREETVSWPKRAMRFLPYIKRWYGFDHYHELLIFFMGKGLRKLKAPLPTPQN